MTPRKALRGPPSPGSAAHLAEIEERHALRYRSPIIADIASTQSPELIGRVLARAYADLGALLEYTAARGEWRERANTAHRELGRAIASLSTTGIEPESDHENEDR